MTQVTEALYEFTQRYVALWRQVSGSFPASAELWDIPSPCMVESLADTVLWQPQPFTLPPSLVNVERALEIRLCDEIHAFYTSQFAGDMPALWQDQTLTLLQVWSEDDFIRLQENLIGHLVTQKRLKLSPTLFIATTSSAMAVVSLCNISGNILLEQLGTAQRAVLAASLPEFLAGLQPVC